MHHAGLLTGWRAEAAKFSGNLKLERLMEKQLVKRITQSSEKSSQYEITPLGRVVAERTKIEYIEAD